MKKVFPLMILLVLVAGCNKDDSNNDSPDITDPVNSIVYDLAGVTNSNITGKATFSRNEDNSTTVFIRLINASNELHPASIRYNSASEGGSRAVTLNSCICFESETTITNLNDGTPIDFDDFLVFDGHINIYESETLSDLIIAQVDIGSNAN